jgi:hypothetical protein
LHCAPLLKAIGLALALLEGRLFDGFTLPCGTGSSAVAVLQPGLGKVGDCYSSKMSRWVAQKLGIVTTKSVQNPSRIGHVRRNR